MTVKNFFLRWLLCLPFLALAVFVHGYHGQLVNNASVQWQYAVDPSGQMALAVDAIAPSGIDLVGIYDGAMDVTAAWELENPAPWFEGTAGFPALGLFDQGQVNPYLPAGPPGPGLYTNGRYTFLYRWTLTAVDPPDEDRLMVRFRNISTGNIYTARHIQAARLVVDPVLADPAAPVITTRLLLPRAVWQDYQVPGRLSLSVGNLQEQIPFAEYRVEDPAASGRYVLALTDHGTGEVDRVTGWVASTGSGWAQVYRGEGEGRIAPGAVSRFWEGQGIRQLAAIGILVYLILIAWAAGRRMLDWGRLNLPGRWAALWVSLLLGLIGLTYLFLVIGTLNGLSWPVVTAVWVGLIVLLADPRAWPDWRAWGRRAVAAARQDPWTAAALLALAGILFCYLPYCFVPANYLDGSGDISNSYLPTLQGYLLRHNFSPAVENPITGLVPQTFDVLRAVMMLMAGEPGVYLLSWAYIWLVIAGLALIGRQIFGIRYILIYIVAWLLLCSELFTEAIHLGKLHVPSLGVLLMALYAARFSLREPEGVLPVLFLGFLTSQYLYFAPLLVVIFLWNGVEVWRMPLEPRRVCWARLLWLGILALVLSGVFYVKLILQSGVCFPPGMIPSWLADLFLRLNQQRPHYRYLDNPYIRSFCQDGGLAMNQSLTGMDRLRGVVDNVNFIFLLVLLPVIRRLRYGKTPGLYLALVLTIIGTLMVFFPTNYRLRVFYVFPLAVLQFAVLDSLFLLIYERWPVRPGRMRQMGFVILIALVAGLFLLDIGGRRTARPVSPEAFVAHAGEPGKRDYAVTREGEIVVNRTRPPLRRLAFLDRIIKVRLAERESLVWDLFWGRLSPYVYLRIFLPAIDMIGQPPVSSADHFDYGQLVREFSGPGDRILAVPVRFHHYAQRLITPRHGLGAVIYQSDGNQIMRDLQRLNIRFLSVIPRNYQDYNPLGSPILEPKFFTRHFRLIFSYKGCKFYQILYDGTNERDREMSVRPRQPGQKQPLGDGA